MPHAPMFNFKDHFSKNLLAYRSIMREMIGAMTVMHPWMLLMELMLQMSDQCHDLCCSRTLFSWKRPSSAAIRTGNKSTLKFMSLEARIHTYSRLVFYASLISSIHVCFVNF